MKRGTLAPYQREIRDELRRRQERNPTYSLRSFARDMGISAPTLSEIINGQRHFHMRTASRAAERLKWPPEKVEAMMREIREASSKTGKRVRVLEEQAKQFNESFDEVAEWPIMAIAHLCQVPKVSAAPASLAKRLGITPAEAEAALAVLTQGEYVKVEKGYLAPGRQPTGPYIITRVNQKVLQYQEDLLKKAIEAIRTHPPGKRLSLMRMVALSPADLSRFEALFWRFYQSVQKRASATDPEQLYCLSAQLFSLTRLEK